VLRRGGRKRGEVGRNGNKENGKWKRGWEGERVVKNE
jgi:hypothetical protein